MHKNLSFDTTRLIIEGINLTLYAVLDKVSIVGGFELLGQGEKKKKSEA